MTLSRYTQELAIAACLLLTPISSLSAEEIIFGASEENRLINQDSPEEFKAVIDSGQNLDWKPLEKGTAHPQDDGDFCFCNGHYEEPENLSPDAEMDPRYAPLHLNADHSEYAIGAELLKFDGNIEGFQGSLQLFADELNFNKNTQDISLKGNVKLREPGTLLLGDEAVLNRKTGAANFKEARFLVHKSGANGVAKEISRTTDDQISMHDASYSLCLPENEVWKIKAEDITLDSKNSEGYARHARMYIYDVPVLYMPYFNFPLNNKRKSGFLFPSYSTGSQGSDLAVPYYLNLAENYDATITPRIVSDRGVMLETEARYLDEKVNAVAGVSLLARDKQYAKDDSKNNSRWLLAFKESGHLDEEKRWTHNVDFQRVSDKDYMSDLGTAGLDVRRETQLQSQANIAYQAKNWDANFLIENFQTQQNNLVQSYKRLPQLSFNYYQPISPNIQADAIAEYTYFSHPDSDNYASGSRIFLAPSVTFKKRTKATSNEIKVGVKQITHTLDNNPNNLKNSSDFSPNVKLDSKVYLEKPLKNGARQTLEPRVQYYYAKGHDQDNTPIFDTNRRSDSFQQFFNEERFSGHDRISDANRITVGVSSKKFNAVNEQLFEAGIAQQFHLSAREVSHLNSNTANASELAVERERMRDNSSNTAIFFNVNPNKKLQINSEYIINSNKAKLDSASIHAHYAPKENKSQIFNAGYQYQRNVNNYLGNTALKNDIHQVSASAIVKAKQNVYLIAETNYDLTNHQTREELIGVEYNSCCWKTRVAYHKEEKVDTSPTSSNIDYTHSVRLEVQLKGLSGISDNLSGLLSESIEGFDTREENFK